MITIKNRFSGDVMFTSSDESQSLRDFILELIKKRANLYGANLSGADLSGADLYGADLSWAKLSGAIMPIFCKWHTHGIVDNKIKIGCETRSIEDWDSFFASDEVITTPRNTDEFKQIMAVYESYKAYLTHMK